MSTSKSLPIKEEIARLAHTFFKAGAKNISRHESIRLKYPGMDISSGEWLKIFMVSLMLGLALYGGVVGFSYSHAANAMQTSRATFTLPWKPDLPTETAAAVTLEDLGISADEALKKELISAMGVVRGATKGDSANLNAFPTLALATQLVKTTASGACSTCEIDCDQALQPVLTRMLLGWPMSAGGRAADVSFLHNRTSSIGATKAGVVPSQKDKDRACRAVGALRNLVPTPSTSLLAGRQEPWPAPLVAQLVLGSDSCISTATQLSQDRCFLVTRLFQAVIDDADVKFDRAFFVDFFYGWERALVAILVFIVGLALLRQRKARSRLELETRWVREKLENESLQGGLDPTYEQYTVPAPAAAIALKESFIETFNPKFDGTAREPVAEIVVAAAEAVTQEDHQYLETYVDRNLSEMDSSRELINSLITIFPVIGFSATLLSLVNALSGANQIATSSGDLRSAAILNVTSLLSSCFATTFLALVSMAVFIVLNLLEAGADKRLLTTLSERLISTFRPGRKYQCLSAESTAPAGGTALTGQS